MRISIIVPIYNERENIKPLVREIERALSGHDYETVFVDDGSNDGSRAVLKEAAAESGIKAIFLQKNYGQTAALSAGIDHASGEVIVPIDGDLELVPQDIPKLVAKLEEGYDVVSGWRKDRWQGEFLSRKIPSMAANALVSKISGVKLHDHGCTLKAYRREILKNIRLYGEMHRFIAAYAAWQGARVVELPIQYRKRVWGISKYGVGRTWRVLLDLLTLKFLFGYATRPIHLFGLVGIISILVGLVAGGFAVYFKFSAIHHKDFIQTPLPVIMAMLVVVGVMLIMLGLLAEILMRTYHESQGKAVYSIREKINLAP